MLKLVVIQIVVTALANSFSYFSNSMWCVGIKLKYSWSDLSPLSASDIYFVLPSAFDILRYILSRRAIAIHDLPINLRYFYKRVSPPLGTLQHV